MMRTIWIGILTVAILITSCVPTSSPTQAVARGQAEPTPLDMDSPLVIDAMGFAEAEGISLEEAVRRLEFQESIGDIQPVLQAELPDHYGGLWVQHQPEYRIVIALTDGDVSIIQPYVEDKLWAEYVEVRPVTYTLSQLSADQQRVNVLMEQLGAVVATAVDVMGNRVELTVGNPELLQADLESAGIQLPASVEILPANPDRPLPETNKGVLDEVTTPDGRSLFFPRQPPSVVSMAALLEGTLVETNGCLRVIAQGYDEGFFVIWPHEAALRVSAETIEVLNFEETVVVRVGEDVSMGGGAMESPLNMSRFDELIPGLPLEQCPGPYWVAAQLQ